jgi:hypothetical protein
MKNLFALALALGLLLPLGSCSNDDDGPATTFEKLIVTDVDIPASFEVGKVYEIPITFQLPDGCTQFETFQIVSPSALEREIVVIGARRDTGSCTLQITETTETLLFQVVFDQTYTFKFWQGDDANGDPIYLEIEVPIG